MIKPLRSNVLIRPSEAQQENKIGIIVTNSVSNQGTVVAVGSEVKELVVGDTVRFDVNSSAWVDSYRMCREADVLCVMS